jgi:polyisoprenoid-binding protein YceI
MMNSAKPLLAMRRTIERRLASAALLLVCIPLCRAQTDVPGGFPAGGNQTALAPAQIDCNLSRIYVHVDKTGFGHEHGVEARFKSGWLQLTANQNPGEMVIDMTSFDADTDEARHYVGLEGSTDPGTRKEVNKNMQGSDVLDVQKFPTAVFKVSGIQAVRAKRPNAPPQLQLDGEFTLHGTTKKLSIVADTAKVNGYTRVFGNFSILQSDFGIAPFRKALGAVGVADRLTIWAEVWVADPQGAAMVQPGVQR